MTSSGSRSKHFRISDETTCGPTCLHAVYRYWSETEPLPQVIDRNYRMEQGGLARTGRVRTNTGPLARRPLRAIGPRPDRAALHELYTALCNALASGTPFDP